MIFYFENSVIFRLYFSGKLFGLYLLILSPLFLENLWVLVSQLEDGLVVWSKHLVDVHVGSGPLIVVKGVVEDLRLKQWSHFNPLVDEINQVVLEKM